MQHVATGAIPFDLDGSEYYSIGEVADLVGRHRTTIWRWRQRGDIPDGLRYCDQHLLYTPTEVEAIYAHAHRLQPDEARQRLRNQLTLFGAPSRPSTSA